jgi:dephospho-CoA kinase
MFTRMLIAGLTGGTGSGKSTAARRFEFHEIAIVDADRVGHTLLEPGGQAEEAVLNRFGDAILTCGTIDRAKLGQQVFSDSQALASLNGIMKPLIAAEIAARCAAFADAGKPVTIVDAALLGDNGTIEDWLEGLILVLSDTDVRVRRLVEARGLSEAQARQRIASQVDPEKKRSIARWVVENNGSLENLHNQVDHVARELITLSRST